MLRFLACLAVSFGLLAARAANADLVTIVDTLDNPNPVTGTGYSAAGQNFSAIPIISLVFDRSSVISGPDGLPITIGDALDRGLQVRAAVREATFRMFKQTDDVYASNWTTYDQGFQFMAAPVETTILPEHPEIWTVHERNAMRFNSGITAYSVSRSDVSFLLPTDTADAFVLDLGMSLGWSFSGTGFGDLESELLRYSVSSLSGSQTSQRDAFVSQDLSGSVFELSGGRGVAYESRITADVFVVRSVPEPAGLCLAGVGFACCACAAAIRRVGRGRRSPGGGAS